MRLKTKIIVICPISRSDFFFFERKGLNFDVFFQSNKRKRERKREKVALLQPQPAIVSNGDSAAAV